MDSLKRHLWWLWLKLQFSCTQLKPSKQNCKVPFKEPPTPFNQVFFLEGFSLRKTTLQGKKPGKPVFCSKLLGTSWVSCVFSYGSNLPKLGMFWVRSTARERSRQHPPLWPGSMQMPRVGSNNCESWSKDCGPLELPLERLVVFQFFG